MTSPPIHTQPATYLPACPLLHPATYQLHGAGPLHPSGHRPSPQAALQQLQVPALTAAVQRHVGAGQAAASHAELGAAATAWRRGRGGKRGRVCGSGLRVQGASERGKVISATYTLQNLYPTALLIST